MSQQYLYDPASTSWVPDRANHGETVLASAAQTADVQTAAQDNPSARGVRLYLDITAASGTSPTLDGDVEVQDPVTGDWVAIPGASFAQATGISAQQLVIYPGIAETANVSVNDFLSRTWRVNFSIGGGTPSFTFSLGADLLR